MAEQLARLRLVPRLARADLRRRWSETILLLVAFVVAAGTLTVGLVLHGLTASSYDRTRAATAGPDVVANVFPRAGAPVAAWQLGALARLRNQPAVAAHSGPYPVTWAALRYRQTLAAAEVEGRDRTPAEVDQPRLLAGTWVRPGHAVVEAALATEFGVTVGDTIRLRSTSFVVDGIAVTAAFPPYPQMCTIGCIRSTPILASVQPGLVWLTRADAERLATRREPVTYFLNLSLRSPASAPAFAAAYDKSASPLRPVLVTWQELRDRQAELTRNERAAMLLGSSLLTVMAIATLVVLIGGRMAEERHRIGVLKAVGAGPGFVALVLLAEYTVVAVIGAGIGLVCGRLVAPSLTGPSAGLLGAATSPSLTLIDAALVCAVAVAVTLVAGLVPALRAARQSTVLALGDKGRQPRRRGLLIGLSQYLPTPGLIGLRLLARRPRRAALSSISIAVATCGVVVVILAQAKLRGEGGSAGLVDPNTRRLDQVMLVICVLLAVTAAVNLVFVATSTALDSRALLAVVRALGGLPGQAVAAMATAQLVTTVIGAALGLPAGWLLFSALNKDGSAVHPPLRWLGLMVPVVVLMVGGLTALASRVSSRRSVSDLLRASSG